MKSVREIMGETTSDIERGLRKEIGEVNMAVEKVSGGKRRHIKFSKCPIEPYKGRSWPKLKDIDFDKPVVLDDVTFGWSTPESFPSFYLGRDRENQEVRHRFSIQSDTFPDFGEREWSELLKLFYKSGCVFGIYLFFRQGDRFFTTFRAYDYKKHNYYERSKGKEFWVKESG